MAKKRKKRSYVTVDASITTGIRSDDRIILTVREYNRALERARKGKLKKVI